MKSCELKKKLYVIYYFLNKNIIFYNNFKPAKSGMTRIGVLLTILGSVEEAVKVLGLSSSPYLLG